jgi:hypothetical protein
MKKAPAPVPGCGESADLGWFNTRSLGNGEHSRALGTTDWIPDPWGSPLPRCVGYDRRDCEGPVSQQVGGSVIRLANCYLWFLVSVLATHVSPLYRLAFLRGSSGDCSIKIWCVGPLGRPWQIRINPIGADPCHSRDWPIDHDRSLKSDPVSCAHCRFDLLGTTDLWDIGRSHEEPHRSSYFRNSPSSLWVCSGGFCSCVSCVLAYRVSSDRWSHGCD